MTSGVLPLPLMSLGKQEQEHQAQPKLPTQLLTTFYDVFIRTYSHTPTGQLVENCMTFASWDQESFISVVDAGKKAIEWLRKLEAEIRIAISLIHNEKDLRDAACTSDDVQQTKQTWLFPKTGTRVKDDVPSYCFASTDEHLQTYKDMLATSPGMRAEFFSFLNATSD